MRIHEGKEIVHINMAGIRQVLMMDFFGIDIKTTYQIQKNGVNL